MTNRCRRSRRGVLLLECLIAIAVFVAAGLTILSMCDQASGSMEASRNQARAIDLARSAMAKIEAGLETIESLNGPVTPWTSGDAYVDVPTKTQGGWQLEIHTEPSAFTGLTTVSVRAFLATESGREVVSTSLHQVVRLGSVDGKKGGTTGVKGTTGANGGGGRSLLGVGELGIGTGKNEDRRGNR